MGPPLVRLWTRIQAAEDALNQLAELQIQGATDPVPTQAMQVCMLAA